MIQLMHGDCLELMSGIPDGSVDMVLCDLPYGTTQNKWDAVIPFDALWREYKRVCKGAIVLTAQTPFDKVLGASNLEMLKYEWIWRKSRATGHLNAKTQPMKDHENVLVFYEKLPTYNAQGLVRIDRVKKQGRDTTTNYGAVREGEYMQEFTNYPRSVLDIPSEGKTIHPTQKPVALMEYLIRTYTNESETILDNCMGSGTTGIACLNTGCRFIGIERDDKYFEIAQQRINNHTKH